MPLAIFLSICEWNAFYLHFFIVNIIWNKKSGSGTRFHSIFVFLILLYSLFGDLINFVVNSFGSNEKNPYRQVAMDKLIFIYIWRIMNDIYVMRITWTLMPNKTESINTTIKKVTQKKYTTYIFLIFHSMYIIYIYSYVMWYEFRENNTELEETCVFSMRRQACGAIVFDVVIQYINNIVAA